MAREFNMPDFPDADNVLGKVEANINGGRWIVECPSGCGCAIVASQDDPVFLCTSPPHMCGGDKGWYEVVFPEAKVLIELLLLKRPTGKTPFYAPNRHWTPGEQITALALLRTGSRGIR